MFTLAVRVMLYFQNTKDTLDCVDINLLYNFFTAHCIGFLMALHTLHLFNPQAVQLTNGRLATELNSQLHMDQLNL